MTAVMGILAGEDRIVCIREMVAPSVLSPGKILNYLNEIAAGGPGFLLDGRSAYSLGYREDFHSNHDLRRKG